MKKKLILFIVIITATYANAQPGTVDTSFNPGTGFNGSVYAITNQSDGKIIVGGQFTSYNGTTRNSFSVKKPRFYGILWFTM